MTLHRQANTYVVVRYPAPVIVTRSARLLVGFVWIACVAYCVALWMGIAS